LDIASPIREKFPEMAGAIAALSYDEKLNRMLNQAGIVGSLISIGFYLFETINQKLKKPEELYFAALMRVMYKSAEEALPDDAKHMQLKSFKTTDLKKGLFEKFVANRSWEAFPKFFLDRGQLYHHVNG
jgi:hypothetical protein